jgi:hypothetical protein
MRSMALVGFLTLPGTLILTMSFFDLGCDPYTSRDEFSLKFY